MWLRHHLLYTKRGRRRQAPQALAPATGSGPRLSLQLTRLCDMRFPFVLAAVVSAAGFAACAPGVRVAATAPAPRAVVLDSAAMRPGRFDAGKMWTFDNPPLDYFQEAYAFRPDSAWLARARLGALRFATYCSASFVSPHGLVLTNHHCSRENTGGVMRPGENFDSTGFYAPTAADERRVPGLFVEQLLSVADVTARMDSALRGVTGDEALARARDQAIDALGGRLTAAARDSSISVQIVSLYEGAQYSAYTYRRYGDVRLVLVPELGMGFFGGDDDNFTYPRYDLDFSVYRVYDASGKPLETPSYFHWSRAGTSDGDAVSVVGNSASTSRLETVAQLEYTRDVQVPATLDILKSRIAALEAFSPAAPAEAAARQGERRAGGGDRQQGRRARAAARGRAVPGPEARPGRAGHARRGTVRGPDGRPGGGRPLVAHRAKRLGARARLVPGRPRGLGRRRVPVRAPGQPGGGTAAPGGGAPVGARRQPRRAARTGPVRRVRQDTPARRHVHAAARRRRGARLPVQRHAGGAVHDLLRHVRPIRGGGRAGAVEPAAPLAAPTGRARPGHAARSRLDERHHRGQLGVAPAESEARARGVDLRRQHRVPAWGLHLYGRPGTRDLGGRARHPRGAAHGVRRDQDRGGARRAVSGAAGRRRRRAYWLAPDQVADRTRLL